MVTKFFPVSLFSSSHLRPAPAISRQQATSKDDDDEHNDDEHNNDGDREIKATNQNLNRALHGRRI